MKGAWGAVLLAVSTFAAASGVPLTVEVHAPPGVVFNRLGKSALTLSAPGHSQTIPLTGVPDRADPLQAYESLKAAHLIVPSGPLRVQVRLYLCDRRAGVCTLETQARAVEVRPGVASIVSFTAGSYALR